MKKLIQKGLYGENLQELIRSCDRSFDSNPLVFHVLKKLFEKIERGSCIFKSAARTSLPHLCVFIPLPFAADFSAPPDLAGFQS
jgi:hypothetical protein